MAGGNVLQTSASMALAMAMSMVSTQAESREAPAPIVIPAQPLGQALLEFSRQTRQQVVFQPGIVAGRRGRAVSGHYTPMEALRRLLDGTGLIVRRSRSGVLVVNPARAAPPPGQRPAPDPAVPPPPPVVHEAIIVTARRREEVLEHVPQTVNVVTGEQLSSLALHDFADLASVVAGLTLTRGSSGTSNSASMRGVTYATETAASPTVEFYLNDTPVSSSFIFQPLFDAGQLEVLRGPQGTLRGRAAPSGAVTVTTRQPDLADTDGYAGGTIASDDVSVQGAAGIPVVPGMAAFRIAGVVARNDYDGVRSLNSSAGPHQHSWGLRATMRFTPDDDIATTLMVQHVDNTIQSFTHLAGSGSDGIAPDDTGYTFPAAITPGYNGPTLSPRDRMGLSENPRRMAEELTIATASATWRFAGQKAVYSGSFARSSRRSIIPADDPNLHPGYDADVTTTTGSDYWTHELRIESETRVAGLMDYIVGAFHARQNTVVASQRGATFGPGAFGSPLGAPSLLDAVIQRYSVATMISRWRDQTESSLFGNLTVHLGEQAELSAGARFIVARRNTATGFLRGAGGYRLVPVADGACLGQPVSLYYPDFCDIPVPAGQLGAATAEKGTRRPVIYNLQLSRGFGAGLMVYAAYATSWRDGTGVIGITNGGIGADGGNGDPVLRKLANAGPETSQSFELGFKAVLAGGRLRLSAAVYQQDFDGLIYRGLPVAYLADNGFSAPGIARFNFTSNVDARVRGIDLDLSWRPASRWDLAAGYSYADGHIANDLIPCNDGNFDAVADDIAPTAQSFEAAGRRVSFCRSQRSVTRSPRWSASIRTEYRAPVSRRWTGYLRGLLNLYPRNPDDNERVAIGSYMTANLYAGLSSAHGWDLSIFAKNVLGADHLISRNAGAVLPEANLDTYFGASGFHTVRTVRPRQVGLNLRYDFGRE